MHLSSFGPKSNRSSNNQITTFASTVGSYLSSTVNSVGRFFNSLEEPDAEGRTPLLKAVYDGNLMNVIYYVENGANIHAKKLKSYGVLHNENVIEYVYTKDDFNIIKLLIENGANIHATNNLGNTPLHTWVKNLDVIKLLVLHGADVKSKTKEGLTVLHSAVLYRASLETIKYLVEEAGADIHAKDNDGNTPIHYFNSKSIEAFEVFLYLVDKGADVTHKNIAGNTLFHTIIEGDWHSYSFTGIKVAIMSLLLKHGADIFARNHLGHSPVHYLFIGFNIIIKEINHTTSKKRTSKYIRISKGTEDIFLDYKEKLNQFICLLNLEQLNGVENYIQNAIYIQENLNFFIEELDRVEEVTEELEKIDNTSDDDNSEQASSLKTDEEEKEEAKDIFEKIKKSKNMSELAVNCLTVFLEHVQEFKNKNRKVLIADAITKANYNAPIINTNTAIIPAPVVTFPKYYTTLNPLLSMNRSRIPESSPAVLNPSAPEISSVNLNKKKRKKVVWFYHRIINYIVWIFAFIAQCLNKYFR